VTIDKYAFRASVHDIEENDYNLNIPRYVDTFVDDEEVDLRKVAEDIEAVENELRSTHLQVGALLKELGYGKS
jgi:type I restriction enzyme M protein